MDNPVINLESQVMTLRYLTMLMDSNCSGVCDRDLMIEGI